METDMRVYLNAEKLTDRKEAHEYIARMLDFPEYYGKNLDALHDCLTDIPDLTLVILNPESGGYFEKMLPVLEASCKVVLK